MKIWVDITKNAVELLRVAASSLPKGSKRDEVESKILVAENALSASNAKLALELGMKLCYCTFPPQIMLWKELEKANHCPRLECGRAIKHGMSISRAALGRSGSVEGPDDWMLR